MLRETVLSTGVEKIVDNCENLLLIDHAFAIGLAIDESYLRPGFRHPGKILDNSCGYHEVIHKSYPLHTTWSVTPFRRVERFDHPML